jgi:anti-anti-sigma regulatory factor
MEVSLTDVRSDLRGFSFLAALNSSMSKSRDAEIIVDCSLAEWFDANMAAPLGTILLHHRKLGRKFRFVNLRHRIKVVFQKNGFLLPHLPDTYETTIPFHSFSTDEAKAFAVYTGDYLKGKGMPRMSLQLRKKFLEGIDEIFNNAVIHSLTPLPICACGQAFPRKNKLEFSISDGGVGFRAVIRQNLKLEFSDVEAIQWALSGENTTRQGDIPGGLGLKIVRDFVRLNGGCLQVASHNGFWSFSRKEIVKEMMVHNFPGTVVNIDINTNDRSSYHLASERSESVEF